MSVLGIAIAMSSSMSSQSLDDLKWKNRILIISAPYTPDSLASKQVKLLNGDLNGLADRKLVVLMVDLDTITLPIKSISHDTRVDSIPEKYVNHNDFQIILIGLDGTMKETYKRPVTTKVLFEKIDAMPMRKDEKN